MQELMSSRSRIRHHIEKYLPSCVDKYLEHVSQDPDNLRERLYTYSEQLLSVQQTMVMERGGVMRRGTVLGEMTSNELGELILEDNTGRIKCQVIVSRCGDHVTLGELVLVKDWKYVPPANTKRCDGYLEVMDMEWLVGDVTAKPHLLQEEPYSIASLKHSIRTKTLPSRTKLDIIGVVTAVGEVLKNGPSGSCTFAIELRDINDPLECHGVLVQAPSLLHMSHSMVLDEIYLFTELRDMLMNKGGSTERRVLATTARSTIRRYNNHALQYQPPDSKRIKRDLQSHDISHPQAKSHDMPLPHSNSDFISYKGTLTKCILPEAGVYQLDNSVLVYMHDRSCLDGGCGLRDGALIELYNIHALKLPSPLLYTFGFYCCAKSLVRVSRFSNNSLPFKPFLSQNKLATLFKKYSPTDVAYLSQTFLALKKRFGMETSFIIVKELTKIAGFSPLDKDVTAEFFSSPHNCPFTLTRDRHGNHPMVATSLSDFMKSVERRVSVGGVKWSGLEGQQLPTAESATSIFQGSHTEKVLWSYAVISEWDNPAQVLVGRLECCEKTGYLTITDSSAAIPLAPVFPLTTQHQSSAHNSTHTLLHNATIGSTVLLSGVTVYVEKTTRGFLLSDPHTSTPMIYINAHLCTPIIKARARERDLTQTNGGLYFRVINKNCIVMRLQMFTAQVMMDESLETLNGEGDKKGGGRPPVQVALSFTEKAFKWYSYVINGGIYSLNLREELPSLKELADSNFLQVTSDMWLELVGRSLQKQMVYDTTDLIDTFSLPGFIRSEGKCEQKEKESMSDELFSLKGVVLSHEYRVHSSTLLAPLTTASSTTPTSQQCRETILALRVQSSTYPDSIMLYYGLKAGQPHPLGLLPGSVATFHSLLLRTSKSGNIYCESTASSSVTLNSISTVPVTTPHQLTSDLTPQLLSLPSVYLGDVMWSLLIGSLTARIICVQCRLTSVQRLSLHYKCLGCGCTLVDGLCMSVCPQSRPTLKAEARFILDDGSGEGHLYANNDMVREVMGVTYKEWAELKEIVIKIGHLTYTKNSLEQQQEIPVKLLTVESRGKVMITELATRLSLHRALKVYCQPFVSSAELTECVLGHRRQLRRGFTTLSLPRLQLRAVAILELTGTSNTGVCSSVTKQLLTKLELLKMK